MDRLEAEQKRLERKQNENINAESELAGLRIRGQISDEAYLRQRGLLLAERKWIAERAKKGQEELEHLKSLSCIAATRYPRRCRHYICLLNGLIHRYQ